MICEMTFAEVTPLEEDRVFRAWLARMPGYRKNKIAALKHAESQRLSLGVGILLWEALKARGADAESAEFAEGPWGQAVLKDSGSHFSLSHAGNIALCAVADAACGCDAEQIGRGGKRLAERFFRPEEQEKLAAMEEDPEAWQREFAVIWTRKESYLKMTGRGMSLPMSSFSVTEPEKGIWYSAPETYGEYVMSACAGGENEPEFRWKKVEIERL